MIKTSVIIPVYNVEEYLDKCIESVLQQSQKEIEIIVVDDGSTDGSKKKIQYYEKKCSFVKAIYQDNHKLGAARNAGVLKARGKYVYFLDSDDYIDLLLLEKCYAKAEENNLDILMFDSKVFIEDNGIYNQTIKGEKYDRRNIVEGYKTFSGKEYWKKYSESGGVYTCAYLFYINKQFFTDNKLYFVPEIFYEDNDWVIRLYRAAKRIMYLPEQLYYRRIRGGSIMASRYTMTHLKSVIIVNRLQVDLMFNTPDEEEMRMVIPRYIGTLNRFIDIFKQFINDQTVHMIQDDIAGLYNEMLTVLERVCAFDLRAGLVTLTAIHIIQMEIKELKGERDIVEEYVKEIFKESIKEIPLNGELNIGVYGIGKRGSQFLELYEKLFGKPVANLTFIDSTKESGFVYRGYQGYNIRDINRLSLDMLVISSNMYGDQMERNAHNLLRKTIPFVRLPALLGELYRIVF